MVVAFCVNYVLYKCVGRFVFVSDMVTPKTTPKLGTWASGVGKINSVLSC